MAPLSLTVFSGVATSTAVALSFAAQVQADEPADENAETPGAETPEITPGETPEITPGETPETTPGETPEVTPGEEPEITPGETPEVTPGEEPEITPPAPVIPPYQSYNNWDSAWGDAVLSQQPGWELATRELNHGYLSKNNAGDLYVHWTTQDEDGLDVDNIAISVNGWDTDDRGNENHNHLSGGYAFNKLSETQIGNIWMDIKGKVCVVTGGDIVTNGASDIIGNRYIMVQPGAHVGEVVGYSLLAKNPYARILDFPVDVERKNITSKAGLVHLYRYISSGDVYISVATSDVHDSIVGRNIGNYESLHFGDTHIFVYNVLSKSEYVNVYELSSSDTTGSILWSSGGQISNKIGFKGCVAGAGYFVDDIKLGGVLTDDNGEILAEYRSNTEVVVDLTTTTKADNFVKAVVGGVYNCTGVYDQRGDSVVTLQNVPSGVVFRQCVAAQSLRAPNSVWEGDCTLNFKNFQGLMQEPVAAACINLTSLGANIEHSGNTYVYVDAESTGARFNSVVTAGNYSTQTFNVSLSDIAYDNHGMDVSFTPVLREWLVDADLLEGHPEIVEIFREDRVFGERYNHIKIEAGTFHDMVVAGDYFLDDDNMTGGHYRSNDGKAEHHTMHACFESIITGTTIDISGGTFRKTVQGTTFIQAQNFGGYDGLVKNESVQNKPQEWLIYLRTGSVNMNLTGGTFGISVTEGSRIAILGGYDTSDICTGKESSQYLTSHLDAEVGDITISMQDVLVNGEMIGGSRNNACVSRNFYQWRKTWDLAEGETPQAIGPGYTDFDPLVFRYAVRQGDITLKFISGQFMGDVYAAGFYDADGGEHMTQTSPIYTKSVTVEIGSEAVFGKITVNGGYKASISNSASTGSGCVVKEAKCLSFTDPGVYTNLDSVTFAYFDTFNVADPTGDVTLTQTLQRLVTGSNTSCTKMGEGTLRLSASNSTSVDGFAVKGGRLVLPTHSNNYETGLVIQVLDVYSNATLDISAGYGGVYGYAGTRGLVNLAPNSTVAVHTSQGPTHIDTINWGAHNVAVIGGNGEPLEDFFGNPITQVEYGAVKVQLVNDVPEDGLNIKLFDGLSFEDVKILGQNMSSLEELGLSNSGGRRSIDDWAAAGVEYAARAEGAVILLDKDGTPLSTLNAYLLLSNDGVLSLTTKLARTLHWSWDGDTWDKDTSHLNFFVEQPADEDGNTTREHFFFRDGDVIVFDTVDAMGTASPDVLVDGKLSPSALDIENGTYVYKAAPDVEEAEIKVEGGMHLVQSDVTFDDAKLTLGNYLYLDDASTLTVNNDVVVASMSNSGTVNVNGSMEIAGGAGSCGGTVNVTGDLTVGGSVSSFTNLTVDGNVKVLNPETNLIQITEHAELGSLSGGNLWVSGETTTVEVKSDGTTTLTSLAGNGSALFSGADSSLVLKEKSQIGNLTVDHLSISTPLAVAGAFNVDDVTITSVGDRLSTTIPMLSAGELGCAVYNMDATALKDLHMLTEGTYSLVKGAQTTTTAPITINGLGSDEFDVGRYHYTATAVADGVQLRAVVSKYDYFSSNLTGENANSAAASLDSLYKDKVAGNLALDGALASVIVALDKSVQAGRTEEAGKLASAAGGASLATLGTAFTDDVHRQLKAIRNRTTTMGVGECTTQEGLPTFNAWINAEGNYHKLSSDGNMSGYTLNSWGGTVGFDVDMTDRFTAGMAVTAMYGDFSADGPDRADGDFDTQYVTLFARYTASAWVHTLVATVGRADVSLDRTVSSGTVMYKNTGDSDGMAFGLMYEVGRVFALADDGSSCIQPLANITFTHASVGGFEEKGTDAALKMNDIEMTNIIIGAGARVQGIVGTTVYNRTSILEGRLLVKANLGDTNGEAENSFIAGGIPGTYKSAEQGAVGVEVGLGITVPVGGEGSSIFADFSADVNSGYSNFNATVGYRVNF